MDHNPDRELGRYREAVMGLAPLHRDIFLLHCLEALPYEQIAARLSVSVETVQLGLAAALVAVDLALEAGPPRT